MKTVSAQSAGAEIIYEPTEQVGAVILWLVIGLPFAGIGAMLLRRAIELIQSPALKADWGLLIGGLVFVLMGALFIILSLRQLADQKRFGNSILCAPGHPCVGREWRAELLVEKGLADGSRVEAELCCQSVRWKKEMDRGKLRTKRRVRNVHRQPLLGFASTGHIEFKAMLPSGLPPSDPPELTEHFGGKTGGKLDTDYHQWLLMVTCNIPGVDLARTFRLRVKPAPAA